jgi:transposase
MPRRLVTLSLLTVIICLCAPLLRAQEKANPTVPDQDLQLLRKDLRSMKKQLVAANMQLTDAEAEKFWPAYDQYASETAKIYDTRYAIIKEYAENIRQLTDAQAQSLARRAIDLDQAVVQLRVKYFPVFEKVIQGKKTALFFQIDRRLALMIDLQLASEIPLVQP